MSYPHVSIIILNWNKWADTIECLESVLKSDYPNFNIILVDNGSDNNSVSKIQTWAKIGLEDVINTNFPDLVFPLEKKPIDLIAVDIHNRKLKITPLKDKKPKVLFLVNDENYGFAIANNIAIDLALKIYQSQYVFLLNNDTVIEPHTINEIISIMQSDFSIGASQATIYSYYQPNKIANAGGMIWPWGQTKYYKKLSNSNVREVAFLNGCALCIRCEIIDKYGALSEDFFYGEEDFEFSMRLKKLNIKKACINNTKVYHKIGISSDEYLNQKASKKVLLFAVNRIVNMKKYLSPVKWRLWLGPALSYFFLLLILQYRVSFKEAWDTIYSARKISAPLTKVDKNVVQSIIDQE